MDKQTDFLNITLQEYSYIYNYHLKQQYICIFRDCFAQVHAFSSHGDKYDTNFVP